MQWDGLVCSALIKIVNMLKYGPKYALQYEFTFKFLKVVGTVVCSNGTYFLENPHITFSKHLPHKVSKMTTNF